MLLASTLVVVLEAGGAGAIAGGLSAWLLDRRARRMTHRERDE